MRRGTMSGSPAGRGEHNAEQQVVDKHGGQDGEQRVPKRVCKPGVRAREQSPFSPRARVRPLARTWRNMRLRRRRRAGR